MSEDKKISLDELEELLGEGGARRGLDLRGLVGSAVMNWPWLALSLVICLSAAVLYLRYREPVYRVSARMLIKSEDKHAAGGQMLARMEDIGFMTNSAGIENEMEILQSRVLVRDVVKDLKLYAEYRRRDGLRKSVVYGTQPVSVDLDPEHLDSLDRELLTSEGSLRLSVALEGGRYAVEGAVLEDGRETGRTFARQLRSLPATVATPLGTLTLTASPKYRMEEGDELLVSIRPPMQVATGYLRAMTVEPTSAQTSIALLTLDDGSVRRGMDFLRRLAVCYNRQANADKNEIALKTEEFINARIRNLDTELGSTDSQVESFKRQNAVTDVGIDASSSVQMSGQFSAQLSEAEANIRILDALRDYVANPQNRYQVIPSNVAKTDVASADLIRSYNQAVQDRSRLLQSASEEAPQVKTLTSTIDELRTSIQESLLQARHSADISRQGIQSQYAKFQGKVSTAPVAERVLTQIGRQQDVKSGLYLMLLQKREENTISLAATADKGRLIDEPLLEGKVRPKGLVVLPAALALGLLLPAGALLLLSLLSYKVEGREDLERLTQLPVIADVPVAAEKDKGRAGIAVEEGRNGTMDEVFRSMRTNIQFMLRGGEKVVMFTSSTAGEGKTFNAANLAVSLALLGKRVVLCGLDIRKPALGRLFGVADRQAGITQLLALPEVTPARVRAQVVPSGVADGLDLLPAGPVPPNPTELLARDGFAAVMAVLREAYDYVILDTAPVGLVTDTIHIGRQADLTAFVCRADYTPKSALGVLNNLASEGKLPNPCVVLNGIDMSKRKYGYYYGYGRYGRYGYGRYGYGKYNYYGREADSK